MATAQIDDGFECGTDENALRTAPFFPTEGRLKALFVFVRFRDDNRLDWGDDWPIDLTIDSTVTREALPAWANDLCEDTGGSGTPQTVGSLAHYFYLMSRDAYRFDAGYPDSVIVLDSTIVQYHASFTESLTGVQQAAFDALDELASTSFSFSDYATLRPDTLDAVVFVFRGTTHVPACGFENIKRLGGGASGQALWGSRYFYSQGDMKWYQVLPNNTFWVTGQRSNVDLIDYPSPPPTGVASCNCTTCPVQATSLEAIRQVTVHEIGHSLFNTVSKDIGMHHLYSANNWCVMHSNGHGNIMHGMERLELGWIDPLIVTEGQTVTLRLYDSVLRNQGSWNPSMNDSTYAVVYPDSTDTSQYFIVENRQQSTVYTDSWVASTKYTGIGQPGPGLLVSHYNSGGWLGDASTVCARQLEQKLSIEPAYGLFDASYEPDPEKGRSRITGNVGFRNVASPEDTFLPGRNNAFAPYTCPSTNLYDASDTLQSVHSGLGVLNIREGPSNSYEFDVRWNQPADRTDGNVTWDGQVILTDDFTVSAGDTVTAYDCPVILASRTPRTPGQGVDPTRVELAVELGGKLALAPAFTEIAVIASARDTTVRKGPKPDGSLSFMCYTTQFNGLRTITPVTGAAPGTADWYGLRLPSITSLGISDAFIKHARAALAFETDHFPSPASFEGSHMLHFLDNYNHVSFDRDVLIPPDSTLTLPQGFKVGFAANRDEAPLGLGRDSTRAELVVQGDVNFNGVSSNNVILRSDDPDSTDTYKQGDWGGMVLLDADPSPKCSDARELDYTMFRDAFHAIMPVDSCFMTMNWAKFENNQASDIYLDRDVVIPEGRRVDLRAPTRIVVEADSSAQDIPGGAAGLVDFIVRGKLVAHRPVTASPSDWLWFESTDKDSLNGNDWAGITFDWTSYGSSLEDADVGFAKTPVFLYWPDSSTVVKDSRIHHFQDQGVWAYGTGSHGGLRIESNTVDRGTGLDDALGKTLVRLEYPYDARIELNKLDMTGLAASAGSAALDIYSSKTFCLTSSGTTDSLVIRRNWVLGPGTGDTGNRTGIRGFWLCGDAYRRILMDENYVEKFKTSAFEFNQSADVQVQCNSAFDNLRVVDLYRTSSATGPAVDFKSNWFEVIGGNQEVARTDDNVKTKLGPTGTFRGDNGLMAEESQVFFIRENDGTPGDKLNAKDNYWYLYDTSTQTSTFLSDPVSDGMEIATRLGPPTDILYTPFHGDDSNPLYCKADSTPTGGAAARAVRGPTAAGAPDRGRNHETGLEGLRSPEIPPVTSLGASGTPARGGLVFGVGIAADDPGRYTLDVFDVRGRKVTRVLEGTLQAGYYKAPWGAQVAPGVYFARLEGPGLVRTRKVVVLR